MAAGELALSHSSSALPLSNNDLAQPFVESGFAESVFVPSASSSFPMIVRSSDASEPTYSSVSMKEPREVLPVFPPLRAFVAT